MEDAWASHINKLSIKELHEPNACEAHLDKFQAVLVEKGLEETPLDGNKDVQEIFTSFVNRPACFLPTAASMKVLTRRSREFQFDMLKQEIGKIIVEAAGKGLLRTALMSTAPKKEYERYVRKDIDERDFVQLKWGCNFIHEDSWFGRLSAELQHHQYRVDRDQYNIPSEVVCFKVHWK